MEGRFKMGSSLSIVGPSQSGKTVFVCNLLKVHDFMFTSPVNKIHWFCGIAQHELMKRFRSEIASLDLNEYQGLPENFDMVTAGDIVVLDDLMEESMKSTVVTHLYTKIVHHRNCFLINISQNLFHKARDSRTRSLNTHYLILFNNPRDATQIEHLSRQMKNKFLPKAFTNATSQGPYSYIMLDFRQETPDEMRIRTRILPHEVPQYAYMKPEKANDIINKRPL